MWFFQQLRPARPDTGSEVERIRKTSPRSLALEVWRRQLEEDAQKALQGTAVDGASASEPVAGPNDHAKVEDRKDHQFAKHRASDRYEQGLSQRSEVSRQGETIGFDIQNDGEARAGRHMRLQQRAIPQQPTQDLMSTLASQRKATVRAQRQVAKNRGSKDSGGFSHLPHPGMWKAQPIPTVRTAVKSPQAQPKFAGQVRDQIAFS